MAAKVLRYSTQDGWEHNPIGRKSDTYVSIPSSIERVQRAFREAFPDPTHQKAPSLRGLVCWIVHTEFEDSFFGKHTLSKKGQRDSLEGILRTLQGGQSSIKSSLSLAGRVERERPSPRQNFLIQYDMLLNGFNGLRYLSAQPIEKINIKEEARAIYNLLHQEPPTDSEEPVADAKEYKEYKVKDSAISSLLRCAHGLSCARGMKLGREEETPRTICYAARPDTTAKLKELVTLIFWTEVKEGRIQLTEDQKAGRAPIAPIELRFVINSLIATFSKRDLIGRGEMPEYQLIIDELMLLHRHLGTLMKIQKNPDDPFSIVQIPVILNYRVYCGNFNFMNALERALPDSLTGKLRGLLISDTVEDLKSLIPKDKLIPTVQHYLTLLGEKGLTSEEQLLLRSLICKEAGLPNVIHCRSGVDRTTIAAAIIYAFNQWTDLGKEIPENPLELLDEPEFKELFWAHIAHAITITSYSRKESGFKWQLPFPKVFTEHSTLLGLWFSQHPTVLRLMPDRLLRNINWWDLTPGEQKELSDLSFKTLKIKGANIKVPTPYFFMLPFLKVMSTLRKLRAHDCDKINKKEVFAAAIQAAVFMLFAFVIGEVAGALLFAFNTLRLPGYAMYYMGVALKAAAGDQESQKRLRNLRTHIGLFHFGLQEKGSHHTMTMDFAHLFLGVHLALAAFAMQPEKILRKGLYIEQADGTKNPLIFGDTPAGPLAAAKS